MRRYTVDASAGAKWFLPEEDSDAANRLLGQDVELCSPDLFFAEMGNILWKRFRKRELQSVEASEILLELASIRIRTVPSEKLTSIAWGIAAGFERSFYDSLYVALSQVEACPLVTGDRKLYNALAGKRGFDLVWVGDLK